MLLDINESCLLIVDVQEKLTPLVHDSEKFLSHCEWLLKAANMLDVPVLVAEQYPEGLGQTVPSLRNHLPDVTPIISKTSFSCARNKNWLHQLKKLERSQVIIIGIETHVCVLQTALDLIQEEFEVYVVADAVSSRNPDDNKYALDRMNGEGVIITTREMVVFEWLEESDHELFREVSKTLFKNQSA